MIEKITESNLSKYLNLAHAYEAEFSSLTGILPDQTGIFQPGTLPSENNIGYLIYQKNIPIGFCIASLSKNINDVAEFYIIPTLRRQGLGLILAKEVFIRNPGKWQVRQIAGADQATIFWRSIIAEITNNTYTEKKVEDATWGMVTCQYFEML